ncbi:hypothetical protein HPB48_021280 [Haemaphysalis longicornis]|uniref:Uncharacterized protein n=1 Tax=Haemaphysalis longicornis TaxID=44386 RepID=A0A9J6FZJ5_HAELO|nr:hypothetical protein HPB48_021280 [Haemaphysalis longicornis]
MYLCFYFVFNCTFFCYVSTNHKSKKRARFPPPDPSLSYCHAVVWRQLQTATFPAPAIQSLYYPDLHSNQCPPCHQYAYLSHALWFREEKLLPTLRKHPTLCQITVNEQWRAAILSADALIQATVAQVDEDAAENYVNPAVTGRTLKST